MAGQDTAQAQDRDQFDFLLKYPLIFALLYSEDCLALKIQLLRELLHCEHVHVYFTYF